MTADASDSRYEFESCTVANREVRQKLFQFLTILLRNLVNFWHKRG